MIEFILKSLIGIAIAAVLTAVVIGGIYLFDKQPIAFLVFLVVLLGVGIGRVLYD